MKRLIPVLILAGSTMLAGCGDSNDNNEVTGLQGGGGGGNVGIEPKAVDDLYATDQNEAFTIAAAQGVLANDQLNTNNPAAVTVAYPGTTAQGGTISGGLNDGSFTYSPAAGFVGTDTFSYTVNNGFGASSATVSIVVDAAQVQQGFVVDSATGNDATGNFDTGSPFATIQGAIAAAPIGADIQVRPGNYTGAVTLKNGQRLLGSGSTLVNAQSVARPRLTGPVNLADGNTLDFLEIRGTSGNAVSANGRNGGTVTNCTIADIVRVGQSTGAGVDVRASSGNWTIGGNSFSNTQGIAVFFRVSGTSALTARLNRNSINSAAGAIAFITEGTANVLAQVNANSLVGSGLEIIVGENSTFGLELEDNSNSSEYALFLSPLGANNSFSVEQLTTLTVAKPGGAGNQGAVNTEGSKVITSVANGSLGF